MCHMAPSQGIHVAQNELKKFMSLKFSLNLSSVAIRDTMTMRYKHKRLLSPKEWFTVTWMENHLLIY